MATKKGAKTTNTAKSQSKPQAAKKNQKSKGLIFGIAGGAVVVVAAIVVAVVMLTGKPDYNKSYEEVKELYAKLKTFTNGSACEKLSNEGAESDVSEETLKGYISECKNEVKEVSEINRKLGATSGVKKDETLKKKFDDYDAKWQTLVSNEDGLEKDLQAYIAMHQFIVKADEIDVSSNPEGMLEMGDVLINSGNESLKKYGEAWNENARAVIDAVKKYQSASSASDRSKYRTELLNAVDKMEDFLDDDSLLQESTNFNEDNADAMIDAFEDLYKSIQNKAD